MQTNIDNTWRNFQTDFARNSRPRKIGKTHPTARSLLSEFPDLEKLIKLAKQHALYEELRT